MDNDRWYSLIIMVVFENSIIPKYQRTVYYNYLRIVAANYCLYNELFIIQYYNPVFKYV